MDYLFSSIRVAGSGLAAQSQRLKVVSENIANANSTSNVPGGDPYRRKTISFAEMVDQPTGASMVSVAALERDQQPFRVEFDPNNMAADENGNVKLPNVNVLVEMADMREANRSYEANIQVIKQARDLISMTIDMMRTT